MHDPMTVAFTIRRPWPQRTDSRPNRPRWSINRSCFWTLAGREYYWPGVVTVWHVDPSGYDSNTDCPYTGRWRWHVHHWRIQVHPLQALRRWLLTRCEWCHGKSRKGDYVNISHQWDSERGKWWQGERGLFHQDCSSIENAHRTCVCGIGPWKYSGYGTCHACGKFRPWMSPKRQESPQRAATILLQQIPAGQRDSARMAAVSKMWREYRETTTEGDPHV